MKNRADASDAAYRTSEATGRKSKITAARKLAERDLHRLKEYADRTTKADGSDGFRLRTHATQLADSDAYAHAAVAEGGKIKPDVTAYGLNGSSSENHLRHFVGFDLAAGIAVDLLHDGDEGLNKFGVTEGLSDNVPAHRKGKLDSKFAEKLSKALASQEERIARAHEGSFKETLSAVVGVISAHAGVNVDEQLLLQTAESAAKARKIATDETAASAAAATAPAACDAASGEVGVAAAKPVLKPGLARAYASAAISEARGPSGEGRYPNHLQTIGKWKARTYRMFMLFLWPGMRPSAR